MGIEAKCGGLAVAAGAAVRRPLQPRDTNVAASTVVVGKKAAAPKPKAGTGTGTRQGTASPSPPPLFPAQCGGVSVVAAAGVVAEVSLAEELEKARARRARLRAARERTEREMESRAEVMERAAAEWERRAEEQRRLVSELMRLIGMPEPDEVYTPVESLRSKEERKRSGAAIVAHSGSTGCISTASTLQVDVGAEACSDHESEGSISAASILQADDVEAEACSDQESDVTGGDNRDANNN